MSPDGIVRYKEGDLVYNTYPCQNQYLTSISADLCPVLEGQDCKCQNSIRHKFIEKLRLVSNQPIVGSTRFCEDTCFSSLG